MKNFSGLLFRALLVFALLAVLVIKVKAQAGGGSPVKIAINVIPPYSTNAKDYIQQGNNVMITLTNMSSLPQQVIVLPSISGNNGVKVSLRSTYQPPAGLLLGPSQVRTLTLNQLKTVNSTVTANDIIVEKMTKEDYLNNASIPEGLYTVCATVKNFTPSVTFEEQACATFVINSYDPPIILNPVANANVKPLSPQFINMGWTPSGVAGKTRYQVKLVDLTTNPINNPNDAFENNNIQPFFQQTNILTNNFILDNSKPKLKEGNKYALQVVAYDPQNKLLYKNKGRSQVIVFTYKNDLLLIATPGNPNAGGPLDDPAKGPCVATTKYLSNISNLNKDGLPNGTPLAIGKFVIRNTVFTKSSGEYDGTGEILVNFLNTKVKVEFKNIRVNAEQRVYSGLVTGKVVNTSVINEAMAKQRNGVIETVPDMNALSGYLDADNRDVSKLNPNNAAVDLPLHIDKNGFAVGVVGFLFEPNEAFINAVLNVPLIASPGDDYLLLTQKGIPVHPNGFNDPDQKLWLQEDATVNLSDKLGLAFNAGSGNTFATFDCGGFKQITIKGDVELSRVIGLPLSPTLAVLPDQAAKVRIPFEFKNVTKSDELIMNDKDLAKDLSMPDANDFAIKVKDIVLDLSTTKNNADFGKAYPDLKDKKDWIGVYIKTVTLTLPEGFKKKQGGRMSIASENAYIDKMGLYTNIVAKGKTLAEGNVAGWGITVDSIRFKISQSKLSGCGMGGVISLPLGEGADLDYYASISKGDAKGADVSLEVETTEDMEASFFLATMKLKEGSKVEIGKEGNKYYAKASLNGELGIKITGKKAKSNVSKLDIPTIEFEELTIEGRDDIGFIPQLDIKSVSLQNKKGLQAKLGGFELNLNNLKFEKNTEKKEVGLSIDMGFSLFGGASDTKNGMGASTNFAIWAKHDGSKYKYDRAELNDISIKADLGVAILSGSLAIYDEDATYGNGFRGSVAASIAGLGVGIDVTLQVGRTLPDKGDYKYWYFDAMVDFGTMGINIPGTAASLYGFGGGAWCNMTRSGGSDVLKPDGYKPIVKGGAAPTRSGVTMVPQKNKAGFKAAVLFGITGSREAFNGDLKFTMELDYKTLSVNYVILEGNAYLMQNPTNQTRRDPDKAFVHCDAKIEYDKPNNVISGNFGAHVNLLNFIKGGGDISFKFDMPDRDAQGNVKPNQPGLKWYIKVGQWTPNTDPFKDDARLHAKIGFDAKVVHLSAELNGYFMVGNDLPSGLPPLPDYIYAITKDKGAPLKKDLPAAVSSKQGLAFAFGAGVKVSAGFDFFVISAEGEVAAGFDVLLSDLNATCNGEEMGFSGWYAQGQAYAYVSGVFKVLRIPAVSFIAGAVLQVKLPNPTWVRGDVTAYINVLGIECSKTAHFERGSLCDNMKIDVDPFEQTNFIKKITPGKDAKDINPMGEMRVDFHYGNGQFIKVYDEYTGMDNLYQFSATMKLRDKDNKEVDAEYIGLGNYPYKSYTIRPKKTLKANTTYYIDVKGWIYDEKDEKMKTAFTTGDLPSTFGMSDLYETYPLPNQRYFMKQKPDGTPARGMLALKQDLSYLFEGNSVYVIFLDGKQVVAAVPASGSVSDQYQKPGAKVFFEIPQELKNNKVYHLQLLASDKDSPLGKVIFEGFHFKTSKYNNFTEKLASFKVAKTGYVRHTIKMNYEYGNNEYANDNVFYVPTLMVTGGEPLDGYEMFGYYKTMDGEQELFGQLLKAGYKKNSFMTDVSRTYQHFKTDKGIILPQLSESEYMYLNGLSNFTKSTERPGGFPFYGKPAAIFTTYMSVTWMRNIKTYEPILRDRGDLASNEKIVGPEGPLTADEINGGGGGGMFNNNLGKSNGDAPKKEYYALMDYAPFIAAYDHMKLSKGLLNQAKKKSANDVAKTFNLIKKLGLPKMPSGNMTMTLFGPVLVGNGKSAEKDMNFNYNPPQ